MSLREMEKKKVRVLEECRISPPLGSVPANVLPLTYFDLRYLDKRPIQELFFYKLHDQPKTTTKSYFMDTILPTVKHSLSRTLQHFYPLAGKITWPIDVAAGTDQSSTKPKLVYSDGDKISLTISEVIPGTDYLFSSLISNHPQNVSDFKHLYSGLTSMTTEEHLVVVPLLTLQETLFPDQGICVGINHRQVATDGRTTSDFIKSWASVCYRLMKGDPIVPTASSPIPFYERSTITNTMKQKGIIQMIELREKYKNATKETLHTLLNIVDDNHHGVVKDVRATFVMSHYNIKKLKQWILSSNTTSSIPLQQYRLSSLVVTCAYIWVCWIKAKLSSSKTDDGGASEEDAIERLIVPIDVRAHLQPPLPITYFGNCVDYVEVVARRSDLIQEDGVSKAAKLMAKGIRDFDVHVETGKYISYYSSLPIQQCLLVGSSPTFGVYDADFGWGGKPEKVELLAETQMRIIFFTECPDKEQGALQFGWVCNPIQMEAFAFHFEHSLKSIPSFSLM